MKLTIATITARAEPHYDWLIADLAKQSRAEDEIELVAIDFRGRDADRILPNLADAPAIRRVTTSPPKPSPWQGPYRVTRHDLHAIANARNTALCLASHPYVAFLDDRVHIGPAWLDTVRAAAAAGDTAICGPCDRDELGTGRAFDDRKERAPDGRTNVSGDWFYGGNWAAPLSWLLDVNGHEEGTDPVGRQDRVLGHMIINGGGRIDYLAAMGALLDRKLIEPRPFPRIGKGVPPADKGRAIMKRFATRRRTELTPDLLVIRAQLAAGEPFPMHGYTARDLDWFDNQPIGQM